MCLRDLSPGQTLGLRDHDLQPLFLAPDARRRPARIRLGKRRVNTWQHVIVDGGLNDGGAGHDYDWGRFDASLAGVNGWTAVTPAPEFSGQLKQLRIYPVP